MARTRTAGTSRSGEQRIAARTRSAMDGIAPAFRDGAITIWLLASALAVAGCGGDDSSDGDAQGTAGESGGGAGDGSAGSSAGNGGGDSGRSGNGGSGRSGSGGNSGGSGSGSGGSNGSSGSGGDDGGDDGGTDPTPTTCRAPVPAQQFGNECPDGEPVALELELVAGGLDVPVFVTAAPGDESRLFVLERSGRIVILDRDSGDEIADFLNLPDVATSDNLNDERGLLGLAFHPDYPDDPRFFVYYSAQPNTGLEQTLSAFEVSSSDPDAADPDSEMMLQTFDDPAGNHNGGMLAFGPDGCLYVGSGDGGNSDDMGSGHEPEGNGQNLDTPLGKLLRFDVDDPDNAAPGNLEGAGFPHIWDYGLRNPWRFSFDRQTHDLYIGDVGQGAWEEVDVSPAGVGNRNWGWRVAEGNHCRPGAGGDPDCDLDAFEPAVDEYPHGGGDDCVVGGYVYRGSAIPSLQGWYVYGDNGPGRRIRAFVWDGEGRCGDNTIVLSDRDGIELDADITSFGEDASGELYLTTSTSVYRFVAQ